MVYISNRLNKYEFNLKKKYGGINKVPSDIIPEKSVLIKLLLLSFFGRFVAGAFGLGGGVIFNPILLSLGMPPIVSSATGAYLITFSKISSYLVYTLSGYFVWDNA